MKVCVIGFGAGGIVATKHLSDDPFFTFDVYEQSSHLGGTWLYQDAEEASEFSSHSSMYRNLRTNLPKEVMEFEGHHYPERGISYIPAQEVHQYLCGYVLAFDLLKYVKFRHKVTSVERVDGVWRTTVKTSQPEKQFTLDYDAVLVCNGHYSVPNIPHFEGIDSFNGLVLHSHKYRIPDVFKGKDLLITGMGPSAQDITFDVAPYANKVYLSHHDAEARRFQFWPKNVIQKPDVLKFSNEEVAFKDGSQSTVNAVLYCTGYFYSFPFLTESCGVMVEDNYTKPLFRHMFNIQHPTMAFIGLPAKTFIFPMLETQVKCALSVWSNRASLPSRSEMTEDTRKYEDAKRGKGRATKMFHWIAGEVDSYIGGLCDLGHLPPLRPVVFKILEACKAARKKDLSTYRNKVFRVIDDENYFVEDAREC